ncbi:RNA polymerase sigma factor [Niabella aquatica]
MFNEKEIVSKVLNGNMQAFGQMVKQYEQFVFYIVDKLTDNENDKEDIAQEVFIKVYNNLRQFSFKSKLSTWIAGIAYRTALNYIRDYRKYDRRTGNIYDEKLSFTTETPEELSEYKDIKQYINRLLEEMPLAYKSVIVLYHFNELTYKEIEAVTGMPEGTVKTHLFRARKILKEKIKNNGLF